MLRVWQQYGSSMPRALCDFSLLRIDGYYDFDNDLQILLEKLGKKKWFKVNYKNLPS